MRKCMIQLVLIVQCMIYLNVYAIDIKSHCPRMVQNVFDGYAPIGMCVSILNCVLLAAVRRIFIYRTHYFLYILFLINTRIFCYRR